MTGNGDTPAETSSGDVATTSSLTGPDTEGNGRRPAADLAVATRAQAAAARHLRGTAREAREEVVYVGAVTRTLALAIDAALIDAAALAAAGVALLVASVLPVSNNLKTVAAVVGGVLFVLWTIAYFTAFWTTTGQTPGGRVMQIRVVRADGTELRPRHALLRLAGIVVSVPLLWGFLPILVTARRRGVPDAIAGTVVIAATPRET